MPCVKIPNCKSAFDAPDLSSIHVMTKGGLNYIYEKGRSARVRGLLGVFTPSGAVKEGGEIICAFLLGE